MVGSLAVLGGGVWWINRDALFIERMLRVIVWVGLGALVLFILLTALSRYARGRVERQMVYSEATQRLAEAEKFGSEAEKTSAEARKLHAEAAVVERDAERDVIIADGKSQIYVRDKGETHYTAMHRHPAWHINGPGVGADQEEWLTYWGWLAVHQAQVAEKMQKQIGAPASGPPTLFDALGEWERALVVGPSGSGKTTVLNWLISRCEGHILMIDPHDDRATWPDGVRVVGGGQDWDSIVEALRGFAGLVQKRYQERYERSGSVRFAPVWLFSDEWYDVHRRLGKDAAEPIQEALTGGRKIDTRVCLGSHSELVKPLGFEGKSDLRKGFRIVRLYGDAEAGITGTFEFKDSGEMPIMLPGPFVAGGGAVATTELGVSEFEGRVLAAWDNASDEDRKPWKVGRMVYGSQGGWQTENVLAVLRKHGRV
jgi:hypothetical protein